MNLCYAFLNHVLVLIITMIIPCVEVADQASNWYHECMVYKCINHVITNIRCSYLVQKLPTKDRKCNKTYNSYKKCLPYEFMNTVITNTSCC